MSTSDRQKTLFLAEDWTKIYQSFRNANFDSYDFDTIRRAMIDYIQLYYPEDFNDFIESSEYVALIDLIAYVAQSISYRVDLNARENFLDTAQRRDSILRLARFLNYKPKRNQAAQGLVKITSISTTESVIDSLGNNLANLIITWNDAANPDYLEQFTAILNSSLEKPQKVGKPVASKILNGISTDLYRFNTPTGTLPLTRFSQNIEGQRLNFEIVNADITDKDSIYEASPAAGAYGFIYRSDGKGNGSSNTGYFMYLKQGSLTSNDINFPVSVPNDFRLIDIINVNETDVWLYSLDQNGNLDVEWTLLESNGGNSVIYNSLTNNLRTIYSINSNDSDRVQLEFGDGVFSEMPLGNFRVFVRQSDSVTSALTPANFSATNINLPYIDKNNIQQTLTLTLTLTNSYQNGADTESQTDIQNNAPINFYTQNRMITGEDYTIFPLTSNQNIIKVKAINRTASGISQYFDVLDPTQKYSSTVSFADDGYLYKENFEKSSTFTFTTINDIIYELLKNVQVVMGEVELQNFYLGNYAAKDLTSLDATWHLSTRTNNGCTGYVKNDSGNPIIVGNYTSNNLRYLEPDCYLKIVSEPTTAHFQSFAGDGVTKSFTLTTGTFLSNNAQVYINNVAKTFGIDFYTNTGRTVISFVTAPALGAAIKVLPNKLYFTPSGTIVASDSSLDGYRDEIWLSVAKVVGDGTNNGQGNLLSGLGPVVLNQYIPNDAKFALIYPKLVTQISNTLLNQMITLVQNYRNFGLRYDYNANLWLVITDSNLDENGDFSLTNTGDTSNTNLDASWLIKLTNDGTRYTVTSRASRLIFGSALEHRFFYESSDKIYDYKAGSVVKDHVTVSKANMNPAGTSSLIQDYNYLIYDTVTDSDGYINNDKVKVNFYDENDNSVPDNPNSFDIIVNSNSYVFFKRYLDVNNFSRYQWIDDSNIIVTADHTLIDPTQYLNGQIYYDYTLDTFYEQIDNLLVAITDSSYIAKVGRDKLKFEHVHYALNNRRIDPSLSNIIELYILTQNYDTDFRSWLSNGQIGDMPMPPTSDELSLAYGNLNNYKAISDEIIFFPVKYRTLFGANADAQYQATFKVIKNSNAVISDNEVKTKVIYWINQYFALGNFDFGDKFYFTELVSYIHKNMAGIINSVVIVPNDPALTFGGLFEIQSQPTEIFISTATVNDVYVVQGISSQNINASGAIS